MAGPPGPHHGRPTPWQAHQAHTMADPHHGRPKRPTPWQAQKAHTMAGPTHVHLKAGLVACKGSRHLDGHILYGHTSCTCTCTRYYMHLLRHVHPHITPMTPWGAATWTTLTFIYTVHFAPGLQQIEFLSHFTVRELNHDVSNLMLCSTSYMYTTESRSLTPSNSNSHTDKKFNVSAVTLTTITSCGTSCSLSSDLM